MMKIEGKKYSFPHPLSIASHLIVIDEKHFVMPLCLCHMCFVGSHTQQAAEAEFECVFHIRVCVCVCACLSVVLKGSR